jgi:hypothetical protein
VRSSEVAAAETADQKLFFIVAWFRSLREGDD